MNLRLFLSGSINAAWRVYASDGTLFSHRKEGSTDSCYNGDEPCRPYAERNQRRTATHHARIGKSQAQKAD